MAEPMEESDAAIAPLENYEEMKIEEDTGHQKNQNPASSASNTDSDSYSDDGETQDALQLQNLEVELSTNPSNYDTHVEYIKLLRRMGEIEKLRKARESMSEIFPLSPSMWQEWAKDETTLASGPDAVAAIEQLYERGVSEYLSVPLWCDYLSFIQEHDSSVRTCSSAGVSKARNLFERAVTAAGLHFAEGNKIWEAYKEFEQTILHTVDEADTKAKESQVQRIRSIFHRQLSVPLANMSSNLLAYKAWEVEQGNAIDENSTDTSDISSNVASAYRKAFEMYNARFSYEEQICKPDLPDSERLLKFMGYLKFEESSGDRARLQILYERCLTEFPISSDMWLSYTQYLDKTLKVWSVIKGVYSRATRNCPWVGQLWVRYLLSLERAHSTEEEICLVFEKALQCTFLSYEENSIFQYLELFLTRIDGLRRRISVAAEVKAFDYSVIRETFQRASDYLSTQLKGTDELLHLHSYWARLEIILGNDIAAARGVWESFLKISGPMLGAWKAYIELEIEKGNIHEARSIYRRCYTKKFSGFGSEDICRSWLKFEREFGTLDDYDYAVQKVSPRLEELRLFSLQQEPKIVAASTDEKEKPSKKNVREKRKPGPNATDDQSAAKRPKKAELASSKGLEKDVGLGRDTEEVLKKESEGKMDKQESITGGVEETKKEKRTFTDQCTAFISNLNFQTSVDDLRNFFSDTGGVVTVRILKHRDTGRSRGLAYVDFMDDAHLEAAVAKNKQTLQGKRLSIARSDPTKSRKHGSVGRGDRMRDSNTEQVGSTNYPKSKHTSRDFKQDGKQTVELKGKNTFAVPRNVRALGFPANNPKPIEGKAETLDSNEEFRKMLLKKQVSEENQSQITKE